MSTDATETREQAFDHDAFFYAGDEQFLAGATPFVRGALEAGEPILVIVSNAKMALLRDELGRDADEVGFADMLEVGANPARIIPVWRQFIDARTGSGTRMRGIDEPIWAGRSDAELVEAQRHEALINLAFADVRGLSFMCPYDTSALDADVIAEAHRSHPAVVCAGTRSASDAYGGLDAVAAPFSDPLPEPRAPAAEIAFDAGDLARVRDFIAERARAEGLVPARTDDLVIAVNEIASNSVRHAGGRGTLRAWREQDAVICEVRDGGHIADPLAGRIRPASMQVGGYGLWLANQICDLVQLRSYADGNAVRVHVRTG